MVLVNFCQYITQIIFSAPSNIFFTILHSFSIFSSVSFHWEMCQNYCMHSQVLFRWWPFQLLLHPGPKVMPLVLGFCCSDTPPTGTKFGSVMYFYLVNYFKTYGITQKTFYYISWFWGSATLAWLRRANLFHITTAGLLDYVQLMARLVCKVQDCFTHPPGTWWDLLDGGLSWAPSSLPVVSGPLHMVSLAGKFLLWLRKLQKQVSQSPTGKLQGFFLNRPWQSQNISYTAFYGQRRP